MPAPPFMLLSVASPPFALLILLPVSMVRSPLL